MNRAERLRYIFRKDPSSPVSPRFAWLETALMGDIQTFIDGIDAFVSGKKATKNRPRGGGNVCLPIVISTGLELVAALYIGKTEYTEKKKKVRYNATQNVVLFVEKYFPNRSKHIPRIIWDGVRNGIDHTFQPKVMRRKKDYIQFTFYVHKKSIPSFITKNGNIIKLFPSDIYTIAEINRTKNPGQLLERLVEKDCLRKLDRGVYAFFHPLFKLYVKEQATS